MTIGLLAPYEQNSGNITLEFTVGADNVRGSAQVFDNSQTLAFGTYPLQEISTTTDMGITLINQDLALTGGVTLGDTPGFPVTLSRSGSYILTSNLIIGNNTTGIFVRADNVTIDLNGFAIIGPGFSGIGRGVEAEIVLNRISFSNTTVVNGTIEGVGNTGVRLADTARVENVRVTGAGLAGIDVSSGSTVTGNTVVDNGDFGISAGSGSMVNGNTVSGNGQQGLLLGTSSGYGNNVLTENNGGNANPQVDGGLEIGTNVCGLDTICP